MLSLRRSIHLKKSYNTSAIFVRMLSSSTSAAEDDVLFHVQNQARVITLNRAAKYNALNTSMVDKIAPRLKEYSKSDQANLVIMNSSCKPSFCSGGDVVACAKLNQEGLAHESIDFFNKEYNLNYFLSTYNKPIVCMLNGITMGGGAGLSVHTPFRVASEGTKFAMPEANIGFFSDVGTTFYLNKLDYNLGYYLLLTGDILEGLDSFVAGVSTHYVPLRKFDELTARLSLIDYNFETLLKDQNDQQEIYDKINNTIEEFTEPIPKNYKFKYSLDELNIIEKCFQPSFTIHQIFEALTEEGSEFSKLTLAKLNDKSPTSLYLILEMLKRGKDSNIHELLKNELILASNMMAKPELCDFNECITKRLINKKSPNPEDKVPVFKYKSIAELDVEVIDKELLSASPEMTQIIGLDSLSPSQKIAATKDEKKSPILKALAALKIENYFNYTFSEYPHQYQLPTAEQVKNYVTGNDNSNRSYAVTRDEVFKYFNKKYNSKLGLEYKLDLILKKNTVASKFGEEYLEWVE